MNELEPFDGYNPDLVREWIYEVATKYGWEIDERVGKTENRNDLYPDSEPDIAVYNYYFLSKTVNDILYTVDTSEGHSFLIEIYKPGEERDAVLTEGVGIIPHIENFLNEPASELEVINGFSNWN